MLRRSAHTDWFLTFEEAVQRFNTIVGDTVIDSDGCETSKVS